MRTGFRATLVAVVLLLIASAMLPALADSHTPIGPNQHFIGLVNGSNVKPAVYTACPGPIWPGRTGPVVGGQTMSVGQVASGHGYTGLFSHVYAWFVPTATARSVTMLTFTRYGAEQAIPSSIQVPCQGPGQVEFSSCPYLAPCAAGFKPDLVSVQFVDIAV